MNEKIHIEGGKLTVELDEIEEKIFKRTFPWFKVMISQFLTMMRLLTLIMAAQGEENIKPYLERIERGENAEEVVRSMLADLNIPIEELTKRMTEGIEMPSDLDIAKMLGWRKD